MKRRQLLKRSNNALKAIDGTLKSSGLPLCCGCGMELDVNTVNPKREEKPCSRCGESTTWRVAV
jgi:hypothetical protein